MDSLQTETEDVRSLQTVIGDAHSIARRSLSRKGLIVLPQSTILKLLNACNYSINRSKSENIRDDIYNKSLDVMYSLAGENSLNFNVRWHIFNILRAELFIFPDSVITLGSLDELYDKIFVYFEHQLRKRLKFSANKTKRNNHIIITTSQFLSPQHSPTKRVLDYAVTIQNNLEIPVKIINDALTSFIRCDELEPSFNSDHIAVYDEANMVEHEGHEFQFKQMPANSMPNIELCKQLITLIQSDNPRLVLNIGGASLVSDICRKFTDTACLPCSYDIPISCSKYLLVPRPITEADKPRLGRIRKTQQIIETNINYSFPNASKDYCREDFNFDDKNFIISIVGNRLTFEVDEGLIINLERLLNSYSMIGILVIGEVSDHCAFKVRLGKFSQVNFAGPIQEGSQAIKITDLFVNPLRKGGGRSVFESLFHGVPVVTPKFGDGYYAAGNDFSINKFDDLYDVTSRYLFDKEFYYALREKALQRSKILGNIVQTQSKMLEKIFN